MKNNNSFNKWMIASIIILVLVAFLSGYLISQKIEQGKLKSMQPFYHLGYSHGQTNLFDDLCDDGLITIQGQKIPLVKLCEAKQ